MSVERNPYGNLPVCAFDLPDDGLLTGLPFQLREIHGESQSAQIFLQNGEACALTVGKTRLIPDRVIGIAAFFVFADNIRV